MKTNFNAELIEVIVPVYNVADYLQRCICSLIDQKYYNIRIWLVDDGSTDNSSLICDYYANKDSRIKVIHKKNGGLSSARNVALDTIYSQERKDIGSYIAFVDSDDWVESDYIEFLFHLIKSTNCDIAQCGHFVDYSPTRSIEKNHNHSIHVFSKLEAIESLLRNDMYDVTAWNKLYNSKIMESIRFPEGILYEDTATAHLFVSQASLVCVCMEPKYHYVQRYESIANGKRWTNQKLDFIKVGDEFALWAIERYPFLEKASIEKRVFVRLSTLSQMVNTGYYNREIIIELKRFIGDNAFIILTDPKSMLRDKLGVICILLGFKFYSLIWSLIYRIQRRL